MKSIFLTMLLMGSLAMASGKITIEESYSLTAKKVPPPTIGIGVWEKISGPVAYSMWTGLGHQARLLDDNVRWFVTKHELIYHIGNFAIAAGYAYKQAQKPEAQSLLSVDEHKVYGKLSLKLW